MLSLSALSREKGVSRGVSFREPFVLDGRGDVDRFCRFIPTFGVVVSRSIFFNALVKLVDISIGR